MSEEEAGRVEPTMTDRRDEHEPLPILVRVAGKPASPSDCHLGSGRCVIGAGGAADIVIDDPRVSREHVALSLVPEGVEAVDLGSSNGTFYLGQRVHRLVLAPGSRLAVGDAEVIIEPDLRSLASMPEPQFTNYRGVLGLSPSMRRLFAMLVRIEGSLVGVLIRGESGVGKELVARAIAAGSSLCDRPLVIVNCATLNAQLAQSELFGHKKGAFTGAIDSRIGAFEQANGGTLFLDEIGELPLEVQPMLLRALETGEVKPVGDNEVSRVKVRIITATNRDLLAMAKDGQFREDLYYRLAVVKLHVPALRDRPDDLEFLAQHFARQVGLARLPKDVLERLRGQRWPGNARELRNAVTAYATLGALDIAAPPSRAAVETVITQLVDIAAPFQEQKDAFVHVFARAYLRKLLDQVGGSRTEAAKRAGVDRSYFSKLLSRYGVS